MHDRYLHIVAFDIPVPVNYGGAIDIFYKLKSLKQAGVKIILHCFEYDRKPEAILYNFCEKVFYYKRNISKTRLFYRKPYIVVTRDARDLMSILLKDDHPILFEGLHTTFFLSDKRLKERKKIVRMHNVEHHYYQNLSRVEKNPFKKYYFLNEAGKLAKYESVLEHADGIAAISIKDTGYFLKKFGHAQRISAFHPHEEVTSIPGKGRYALYHGSLEIGENNQAALFLVNDVFSELNYPLIIAGNKPSEELINAVAPHKNIEIKSGISSDDIYRLIDEAHINILPTFQATGIKLKLLAALYRGRHCVVNSPMVENTGLENLCYCTDNPQEMRNLIIDLSEKNFEANTVTERQNHLANNGFSNKDNVALLIKMLYDGI